MIGFLYDFLENILESLYWNEFPFLDIDNQLPQAIIDNHRFLTAVPASDHPGDSGSPPRKRARMDDSEPALGPADPLPLVSEKRKKYFPFF